MKRGIRALALQPSRVELGSPRNAARVAISALLCLALAGCATGGSKSGEEPKQYVLIPAPPQSPRIQYLRSYTSNEDVLPPLGGFRRFVLGERQGWEIGKPYGVAMHDGQILVCDTMASLVLVFDLRAQAVATMGGGPNGRLLKPINVAVDEDGTRYVADTELNRIMVFDRENNYLRAFGNPESWTPSDVIPDGKRLYVTDIKAGQVVVLDKSTGEEIRRFSQAGAGKDDLFFPTNIDIGPDGSVYVADTGNFRIVKYSPRGKLLQQFGSLGRLTGQFVRPKGVAVDQEGRVYVVDAASEIVQIFDPDGELLLFFGGAGNQPGGLNIPAKVTIDYENVDLFADLVAPGYEIEYLVLVTSQFGVNKVNVFGFLRERRGGDKS